MVAVYSGTGRGPARFFESVFLFTLAATNGSPGPPPHAGPQITKHNEEIHPMRPAFRFAAKPLALALSLLGSTSALALQWELANGVKANVDTTLTYGISVRASGRDPALIGIANGGTSRSVNEDDG